MSYDSFIKLFNKLKAQHNSQEEDDDYLKCSNLAIFDENLAEIFFNNFPDSLYFCEFVSKAFVKEIKHRATDRNSEIASSSIAEFLSKNPKNEDTDDGLSGFQLLQCLNNLTIGPNSMIEPICHANVPSTMAKCLYIFLDLPKIQDPQKITRHHEFSSLFKSLFRRLCTHVIAVEEMCKRDSLRHCFLAMSDSCSKENSHWRVIVQTSLIAMAQNALTTIVLDYIHSTQALVDCLKNLLQGHLSGYTVASVFDCLFHLLRESSNISKVLMDDFRSSGGYILVSDFLLKYEEFLVKMKPKKDTNVDSYSNSPPVEDTEADTSDEDSLVFLLNDLLMHLGRLTLIGSTELRPKSGTTDQTFNLSGFTLPQPMGQGYSIRNIQAFGVLQQVFIKATSEDLCLSILSVILDLYKQDKANYFILAPQKTISTFADVIVHKSHNVQREYFNLLVELVNDLQYIPINEFSNIVLLLDNEKSDDCCLTFFLQAMSSLSRKFSNFFEVFSSLGLIELLMKHLTRIKPKFEGQMTKESALQFTETEKEFVTNLLSFLSICFRNSPQLSEIFCKQGGHEILLRLLFLTSVDTEIEVNDDQVNSTNNIKDTSQNLFYWSSIFVRVTFDLIKSSNLQSLVNQLMAIFKETNINVQIRIVESIFRLMKESKRFRMQFRKAQGFQTFIHILSVTFSNSMKSISFQDMNQQSRSSQFSLELNLLRVLFITLNESIHNDSANSWCLNNEIGPIRLSNAIKTVCNDRSHPREEIFCINLTKLNDIKKEIIEKYFSYNLESLQNILLDIEGISLPSIPLISDGNEYKSIIYCIFFVKLLFILSIEENLDLKFCDYKCNGLFITETRKCLSQISNFQHTFSINSPIWVNIFLCLANHIKCIFPLINIDKHVLLAIQSYSFETLKLLINNDERNLNLLNLSDVISRFLSKEDTAYIDILNNPSYPNHEIISDIFHTICSFSITSSQFNNYLRLGNQNLQTEDNSSLITLGDISDEFIETVNSQLHSSDLKYCESFKFILSQLEDYRQDHPLRKEFYRIVFAGQQSIKKYRKKLTSRKIQHVLKILEKQLIIGKFNRISSPLTRSSSFNGLEDLKMISDSIRIIPAYINFDTASTDCGYLFLPSISPQQPQTGTQSNNQTTEKIDMNLYGGVGFGERVFPPTNGFTYMTWICIEKFDNKNPLKLLTVMRGVQGMNDQMITFSIYLTPNGKQFVVETLCHIKKNEVYDRDELSLSSQMASERPIEKSSTRAIFDYLGDPVKGFSSKQIEIWPLRRWRHIAFVFNRAGFMKHSSCSLYIDGRPIGTQKLDYIQTTSGLIMGQNGNTQKMNTTPTAVCAFIGSSSYDRKNSSLHWKQGPFYFVEEPLQFSQILIISTLDPNFSGNFQNCAISPVDNEKLAPIISEDKLSFTINANTNTTMTLAKISRIYNQTDAKILAKQIGLSSKENSTPIQILVNCASHLSGPARTIGAIMIGQNVSNSKFCQSSITRHFSLDLVLSFIASSETTSEFENSLRILNYLIREGTGNFIKEIHRLNGFQILKELIKKKRYLLTEKIFELIAKFCILPPWFSSANRFVNETFCPQPVHWIEPDGQCQNSITISVKSEIYYRQVPEGSIIDSSPVHNSQTSAINLPPYSIDYNILKYSNKCILNIAAFEEIMLDFSIWIKSSSDQNQGSTTSGDEVKDSLLFLNSVLKESCQQKEEDAHDEIDYRILICLFRLLTEILHEFTKLHTPNLGLNTGQINPFQINEATNQNYEMRQLGILKRIVNGEFTLETLTRIKDLMLKNDFILKLIIRLIKAIDKPSEKNFPEIVQVIDASVDLLTSFLNCFYSNAIIKSYCYKYTPKIVQALMQLSQLLIWTLPKSVDDSVEVTLESKTVLNPILLDRSASSHIKKCLLKVYLRNSIFKMINSIAISSNDYNFNFLSILNKVFGFEFIFFFILPAHQIHTTTISNAVHFWHLLISNYQLDNSFNGMPSQGNENQDATPSGDSRKGEEYSSALSQFRKSFNTSTYFTSVRVAPYSKVPNQLTGCTNGFTVLLKAASSKLTGSHLARCHEIFYFLIATMFGKLVSKVPENWDKESDHLFRLIPQNPNDSLDDRSPETPETLPNQASRFGAFFGGSMRRMNYSLNSIDSQKYNGKFMSSNSQAQEPSIIVPEIGSILLVLLRNIFFSDDQSESNTNIVRRFLQFFQFLYQSNYEFQCMCFCEEFLKNLTQMMFPIRIKSPVILESQFSLYHDEACLKNLEAIQKNDTPKLNTKSDIVQYIFDMLKLIITDSLTLPSEIHNPRHIFDSFINAIKDDEISSKDQLVIENMIIREIIDYLEMKEMMFEIGNIRLTASIIMLSDMNQDEKECQFPSEIIFTLKYIVHSNITYLGNRIVDLLWHDFTIEFSSKVLHFLYRLISFSNLLIRDVEENYKAICPTILSHLKINLQVIWRSLNRTVLFILSRSTLTEIDQYQLIENLERILAINPDDDATDQEKVLLFSDDNQDPNFVFCLVHLLMQHVMSVRKGDENPETKKTADLSECQIYSIIDEEFFNDLDVEKKNLTEDTLKEEKIKDNFSKISKLTETLWKICYHERKSEFIEKLPDSPLALGIESISLKHWSTLLEHPCIMAWADYMKKEASGFGGSDLNDWGYFNFPLFKQNTSLMNYLSRGCRLVMNTTQSSMENSTVLSQTSEPPKTGLTHQISQKFNRISSSVFRLGPNDSRLNQPRKNKSEDDTCGLDSRYKDLITKKNEISFLESTLASPGNGNFPPNQSQMNRQLYEEILQYQIEEKIKAENFLEKEILKHWNNHEHDMTRPRGIWGGEEPSSFQEEVLKKLQLDTMEGPLRMRKKMIPSEDFYSRYLHNYFTAEDLNEHRKEAFSVNLSQCVNKLRAPICKNSLEYLLNFIHKTFSEPDYGPLQSHLDRLYQYLKILSEVKEDSNCIADDECDTTNFNSLNIEESLNDTAKLFRNSVNRISQNDTEQTIDEDDPEVDLLDTDDCGHTDLTSGTEKEEDKKVKNTSIEQKQNVFIQPLGDNFYQPPDNSAVLRLLGTSEQIKTVSSCARVTGLEVHEGLLCFGKQHFYLLDGFVLLQDRRIVDFEIMPKDVNYEPVVPIHQGSKSFDISQNRQFLKFSYSEIQEVHKRRYLLQQIAVEVFTTDGYNILLALPKGLQNKIYQKFQHVAINSQQQSPSILSNKTSVFSSLMGRKNMTQKWERGELTNFEYLMHLNTLAGRSYNDLMQYPIFPWIIADYESEEIDFNRPEVFRDLKKPMGAIGEQRANQFKKRFDDWVDPDGETPPYHYSTHYSSAMIVASYLVRIEPFTQHFLKLQGGQFDLADRMFFSLSEAWKSASSQNMSDVKELIPEFFYLPDFLKNQNNFDFGKKQNGVIVDNVELPPWAKNDPREFIRIHREALESDYVSSHLHYWIDLIFGYKQRGEAAVQCQNVFHYLFYEGNVDIYSITDPIKRSHVIGFINNFGQIPRQLFKKPHPPRKIPDYSKLSLPMEVPIRPNYAEKIQEKNKLDWSDVNLANNIGCKYVARLFYHNLKILRPSLQILKELKHSVGQIVHVKSNSLSTGLTVLASGAFSVVSGVSSHLDDLTTAVSGSINTSSPTSGLSSPSIPEPNSSQLGHIQICGSISAVEQYKYLLPPTYTKYVSWGFNDGSLRVGSLSENNEKAQKIYENIDPSGQIMCTVAPTKDILITGGLSSIVKVWQFDETCSSQFASSNDSRPTSAQRTNPSLTNISPSTQPNLRLLADLYGHTEPITCLSASNQFKIIVSGSADKTVILWDLHRLKFMKILLPKHKTTVAALCIHENNGDIVSVSGTCIHLWSLNGTILAILDTFGIDPYTKVFGNNSSNNLNSLNKRSSGQHSKAIAQTNILCCCMSHLMDWDLGNVIVTGHSDGVVRLWSLVYIIDDENLSTENLQNKIQSTSPDSTTASDSIHKTMKNKSYKRQLVFRGRLTNHHSNNDSLSMPISITTLAISADHLSIFAGDSLGRVFGWFCPDDLLSGNQNLISNISSNNPMNMMTGSAFSVASAGLISSIHASVSKTTNPSSITNSIIDDQSQNNFKCSSLNCSTKFSLTERKQQCRHCNGIFCSKCTKNRSQIYSLRIFTPVRVCDNCFEILQIKQAPQTLNSPERPR